MAGSLVIYNQSNFNRFCGNTLLMVNSVFLFFIGHLTGRKFTRIGRNGPYYRIEPNCGPCLAAKAGLSVMVLCSREEDFS